MIIIVRFRLESLKTNRRVVWCRDPWDLYCREEMFRGSSKQRVRAAYVNRDCLDERGFRIESLSNNNLGFASCSSSEGRRKDGAGTWSVRGIG